MIAEEITGVTGPGLTAARSVPSGTAIHAYVVRTSACAGAFRTATTSRPAGYGRGGPTSRIPGRRTSATRPAFGSGALPLHDSREKDHRRTVDSALPVNASWLATGL